MATKYARLRIGWGSFELEAWSQETPGYSSTQMVSGGDSAALEDGVAVRRASVEIDRSTLHASLDPAYVHFDFMNLTSGNPDDTWIASDFGALETAIRTWWGNVRGYSPSGYKMTRIIWHRVGEGIGTPNPAVRVWTDSTPLVGNLSAASSCQIQQAACAITFRTGVRKSWGRTYLPFMKLLPSSSPFITSSDVDAIGGYTDTMVATAAAADFPLVVTSKHLRSALTVEALSIDDVSDVIRRRRPKVKSYRKIWDV